MRFRNIVNKEGVENYINNTRNEYLFKYNKILDMSYGQEQVFEEVAKDVIDSSITGYNGTIFTYGQTGSGKTYTMTGGAEKYKDRGIIPRTVSYIFDRIRKDNGRKFKVGVSYLEIYNNKGYDLLHEDHENPYKELSDLPKVVPYTNKAGEMILKDLTIHKAENEEDLLNILFIGDTNRVVCETPMNDKSTRSHCIFTIYLESQEHGSELRTYSKINLVDLSGSERVGRTGVKGLLLKEACSINTTLHYLEHVIITLQKKMKGEKVLVPFRNSLMTMMLKDSLGGSCMTRMIATVHPTDSNVLESISTCLFSQRVAMIKNCLRKNEAVDPNILIARLKKENANLKSEIALLKGDKEYVDKLDNQSKKNAELFIDDFLQSNEDTGHKPIIFKNKLMISHCLLYFKKKFHMMMAGHGNNEFTKELPIVREQTEEADDVEMRKEIDELRKLIKERDNEISVLLKLVNEKRPETNEETVQEIKFQEYDDMQEKLIKNDPDESDYDYIEIKKKVDNYMDKEQPETTHKFSSILNKDISISKHELSDKKHCFERFKKEYKKTNKLEEDLVFMKELYEEGKVRSKNVKRMRAEIDEYKRKIEQERKRAMIQQIKQNNSDDQSIYEKELLANMDKLRAQYKQEYDRMHNLKSEIERLQVVIKNTRKTMQSDFDYWWKHQVEQNNMILAKKTNNYVTEDKENRQTNIKEINMRHFDESERKNIESALEERNKLMRRINRH